MSTTKSTETRSQQIFKAAAPTTKELIKALLKRERGSMHMKPRDAIYTDLGQIVKKHVSQV